MGIQLVRADRLYGGPLFRRRLGPHQGGWPGGDRSSIGLMDAPAPVPPIQGRAAEMQALGGTLAQADSGRLAVTLIEGEAGIGKTRLLEAGLEKARDRRMQVVAGRADEMERSRPFGLVADALGCARPAPDPRRAAIAALLATQGDGDGASITVTSDPGLRFQVVDAFTDLTEELALAGPLMIAVDDLQWADSCSLLTLNAVGRRLAYLPVALIGSFRPAPQVAELEQLVGALVAAGARHLALHDLDSGTVRDLVAEMVGAEPGPGLLTAIAGARGNPLFVTELVGALLQEGAIEIADGRAEVAETVLPPTLRLTMLRRLSFLPGDTLEALQAASVLGSGFSVTDLATVTGRPAHSLSGALAEAIRARVVEDDGDRLRFRHDLVRDAIYEDLPASMRIALHRDAGQRLARSGAPAVRVAEHLARGARKEDAEAIAWLTRAARQASPMSPDVAADLLERAIGLMNPADPGRDRLLAEQASSLRWAGRIRDSEKVCRSLLGRSHDPGVEGPARICLGHVLLAGGRPRDGLGELERAGESPVLTDSERARARAWVSHARMWLGDLDGSAAIAEQARSAAATAGDHFTTSIAMASSAVVSELRGRLRDALEIADNAVSLADQSPGRAGHGYALHATRGWILLDLDRFDEARSTVETGRRISEDLGIGWHLPSYQMVTAAECFLTGEWDDAVAELDASIELATETRQVYGLILGRSMLSVISCHRNDLSRAEEAATAALGQLAETGPGYRAHLALWARALSLEAGGKIIDALATLAKCWDQCTQSGIMLDYRLLGADLVRLSLASGDHAQAHETATAVAEIAERNELPSLAGAALHCRGLAENDPEILEMAASAYAQSPRPLELARACEDAGAAFARRGNAARARLPIERALEIYERLDAARDLARAEAMLREAGIRRGRRGPRRRPTTGWQSLTPAERTVAELVAEGLSNPQIGDRLYVSRRTVQAHLAHVFTKLDITSRVQLAAQVTRHQASDPDRDINLPGRPGPGATTRVRQPPT